MSERQIVRIAKKSAVGLISIGVVLGLTNPSFASCEARCKAGKAAQICGAAMNQKGLKGPDRKAEYEKCKMDPYGYK
jgi:hypothetical protein